MKPHRTFLLALCLFASAATRAQNELDAIRFSQQGLGVGARALGMGGAYTGVANDYSAIFYNPAGLGQIKRMEFNLGFDFFQFNSDASYLNATQRATNSRTALQSIGFVMPFPTYQGSFVMGFGFQRQANFSAAQNVSAFNPAQSILDGLAANSRPRFDSNGNIYLDDLAAYAWEQFLLNDSAGIYVNPIRGNVLQTSELFEDGGKNQFSVAASVEVAPALFAGGALNVITGNYSYSRTYRESDSQNRYQKFQSLALEESIESEFSGWSLKASLMYALDEHFRLGLAVETPATLNFDELSTQTLSSRFKVAPAPNQPLSFSDKLPSNRFEYRLRTPFVFSGGASLEEPNFTLSAQATFTDWTQLEFRADGESFADLNRVFKTDFQQTIDYALGAELRSVFLPIRLRAGYAYQMSPLKYRDAARTQRTTTDDARKIVSLGAGILLRKTLNIDVAFARTTQSVFGSLYSGSAQVREAVTTNSVVITTSFRF
ncbi:MAG: outer membrane protein transport protein [Chloroherpetonaceae bacterium]|nr:outer membrane protein transport protein [Chloroherpetonaceae bacterium]MDW8437288.1 outer membrane protein transport protein [Chloroherpetonaceae bacterium]